MKQQFDIKHQKNKDMFIGDMHVSTINQNFDLQRDALEKQGVQRYSPTLSGTTG